MSHIVLVNPQMSFKTPPKHDSYIKQGLALISSCLKERGHKVSLVDFRLCNDFNDATTKINSEHPDMVCITAFSSEKDDAILVAKAIKSIRPNTVVIVGGIHASIRPEDYVNAGCFDYVVRGEGEITVPQLIETGKRQRETIVLWGETPDLDSLPFADRELWSDYKDRVSNPPSYVPTKSWVEVISSRGCPYHCRFCSAHGERDHFTHLLPSGSRVPYIRGRSVENVIKELKELDEKYHYTGIQFLDDQWIMNSKWMWNFCDELEKAGLSGKDWWIGTRVDVLLRNKDLMLRIKEVTNTVMVSLGWESFSQYHLDFWEKETTVEQNYDAVKFLRQSGFKIFGNVIMGAPREDGKWYKEDDEKNISAMKEIQPDVMSWSIFTASPGCDLEKWCIENNLSSAHNTGFRSACESKIHGVNWRWIRYHMRPMTNGRSIQKKGYDTLLDIYDRIMMKIEGW